MFKLLARRAAAYSTTTTSLTTLPSTGSLPPTDSLGISYLWTGTLPEISTSGELFHAKALNDCIPQEVMARQVRIYQPCKTSMQSGKAASKLWKLDFDNADKWENPTMGWVSSADPMQALNMTFNSKEDAMLYAERQGFLYSVAEPRASHFRKKVYAENFSYESGKLRLMKTK